MRGPTVPGQGSACEEKRKKGEGGEERRVGAQCVLHTLQGGGTGRGLVYRRKGGGEVRFRGRLSAVCLGRTGAQCCPGRPPPPNPRRPPPPPWPPDPPCPSRQDGGGPAPPRRLPAPDSPAAGAAVPGGGMPPAGPEPEPDQQPASAGRRNARKVVTYNEDSGSDAEEAPPRARPGVEVRPHQLVPVGHGRQVVVIGHDVALDG